MVKFKLENEEVKAERVREFFTWLPLKIGTEARWGEKVTVKEKFKYGRGWYKDSFVDDIPKLGDSRLRYFFAWNPIEIEGWRRWLVYVTVSELYNGREWKNQSFEHCL